MGCLRRGCRVDEGGVRSQPGLGGIRIVALDEGNLIGLLIGEVVPPVIGVVLDLVHTWKNEVSGKDELGRHRSDWILTSLSVRIDNAADNEILRVEVTPVRQRKRLVCDGVPDRPPHVNDADTSLQETFRVFAKVAVDTLDTGLVSLGDVHLSHWATQWCGVVRGQASV